MNKMIQLLALLGVSEEQAEQLANSEGEQFEQATLDTLSMTNRGKWAEILSGDGKFTEQFTSKGFKAGSTKAAAKTKKAVAEWLGIDITEEMADDSIFQDTVMGVVKAAKKASKTDDAQVKAAIQEAVNNAKTSASKEMEALQIRFQNEKASLVNGFGLDSFIRNAVGNKIPKGGLPVADVLNMAKMRMNSQYSVKHDDVGNVVGIFDKDGHPLNNSAGDGHLTATDIAEQLLGMYFEDAAQKTNGIRRNDPKAPQVKVTVGDEKAANLEAIKAEMRARRK